MNQKDVIYMCVYSTHSWNIFHAKNHIMNVPDFNTIKPVHAVMKDNLSWETIFWWGCLSRKVLLYDPLVTIFLQINTRSHQANFRVHVICISVDIYIYIYTCKHSSLYDHAIWQRKLSEPQFCCLISPPTHTHHQDNHHHYHYILSNGLAQDKNT